MAQEAVVLRHGTRRHAHARSCVTCSRHRWSPRLFSKILSSLHFLYSCLVIIELISLLRLKFTKRGRFDMKPTNYGLTGILFLLSLCSTRGVSGVINPRNKTARQRSFVSKSVENGLKYEGSPSLFRSSRYLRTIVNMNFSYVVSWFGDHSQQTVEKV